MKKLNRVLIVVKGVAYLAVAGIGLVGSILTGVVGACNISGYDFHAEITKPGKEEKEEK